jgi:hypothetical protein
MFVPSTVLETTADDFRDFAFANAARFFGGANPSFFAGTAVEATAAEVLTANVVVG